MCSKKKVIIFIGLQGSGKTYYYNHYLAENYKHINLDELHTRNKEWRKIESYVESWTDFVIDNTNPQKSDRERYIPYLKESGYYIIGYFFESKIQDCIRRNEQREGKAKVPIKAIAATSNKLEMPDKNEGFDEIHYIARNGDGSMYKKEWREQ